VIFVDSNIPMYLVGTAHPNKDIARSWFARLAAAGERLVTDVEVLQEILHRYTLTDRAHLVDEAMDAILTQVAAVYPMEREDVGMAAAIARTTGLSARDAIHVAVMRRRGITLILSFDRGFDGVEGIERIPR
jgi:predicted nucleic acid-binding protein